MYEFGFNCGIKEFGKDIWETTKSELKDNLIGIETVFCVKQLDLVDDFVLNASSYLMFLKRKRTERIKHEVERIINFKENIYPKMIQGQLPYQSML